MLSVNLVDILYIHIYTSTYMCIYIYRERERESRKWQPTPVFLSGKCHGQRSLMGYSP